jgi:hypothetical protein
MTLNIPPSELFEPELFIEDIMVMVINCAFNMSIIFVDEPCAEFIMLSGFKS